MQCIEQLAQNNQDHKAHFVVVKTNLLGLSVCIILGWLPSSSFELDCRSTARPHRSRGRCWAAIRLSYRPEPSGHAVRGEVDGLDIGRQHGRRFVLLRHTHRSQRRTYPHLYKQERKRPTSASRTHAVLGSVIPRGWVPVSMTKVRNLVGLSNYSAFHW